MSVAVGDRNQSPAPVSLPRGTFGAGTPVSPKSPTRPNGTPTTQLATSSPSVPTAPKPSHNTLDRLSQLDELEALINFSFVDSSLNNNTPTSSQSQSQLLPANAIDTNHDIPEDSAREGDDEETKRRSEVLAEELLSEGLKTPRWLRERESTITRIDTNKEKGKGKDKEKEKGSEGEENDDEEGGKKRKKKGGTFIKKKKGEIEKSSSVKLNKKQNNNHLPEKITKSKSHSWLILKKQEEKMNKKRGQAGLASNNKRASWFSLARAKSSDDNSTSQQQGTSPVEDGCPGIVLLSARHVGTFKGTSPPPQNKYNGATQHPQYSTHTQHAQPPTTFILIRESGGIGVSNDFAAEWAGEGHNGHGGVVC